MPFTEAARIALASLRANKLRSFLTVLGILIGVSSVIAVVAITEGLDRYIAEKVLELGTRSFAVQKMPDIITSREQWMEMMRRRDVTLADLEAVRAGCTDCAEVGGLHFTGRDVKYGRVTQPGVQVMGITANVQHIGAIRDLVAGRPLVEDDVDRGRAVAVVGQDVVDAFFPGGIEPLGKEIRLGTQPVTIVGVGEKKGTVFGRSQDNFLWIPITFFRKLYGSRQSVVIQAEATSMEAFERAQDQARVVMRGRRLGFAKPDDFSVETGESVMELAETATRGIYVVTLVVTTISLVVGGVVVMNIMLVSVTERIREIGVRKALGARRRDIVRQFLVESVVLSLFGGLLGLLGAAVFSWGLAAVLGSIMATTFTAPVRLWAVLLALAVSTLVGLVAGIYPARRAAALDPVVALEERVSLSRRVAERSAVLFGIREAVGMGLGALRAYKLRAALTILGVVMGITTVTGMSSIVAGLNRSMAVQIEGFGSAVIFVRPQGPGENLTAEQRRRRRGLSDREVEALAAHCKSCRDVSPMELLRYQTIKYGNAKVESANFLGTTPAFATVHDVYVERGRFLIASDVNRGARVAVIGQEIAETLFPFVNPLDKEIQIDGLRFRVVGVVEKKGKFLGLNRDQDILVPLGSTGKRDSFFNFLLADVKASSPSPTGMERTTEEVREVLRRQRKLKFRDEDTFRIFTQDTLTSLYNQLTGGIYVVMIAISSIGLVVGGVGVMNIMLVSVTERTREIGVRKALGARKADILGQFLTEAMTLTGVGGVLGIAIGGMVASLVDWLSPFPAVLQPFWIAAAFVTSVVVGVVFGLWPAWKASRLDPIEALRYE